MSNIYADDICTKEVHFEITTTSWEERHHGKVRVQWMSKEVHQSTWTLYSHGSTLRSNDIKTEPE
jgi:hypothetical protein